MQRAQDLLSLLSSLLSFLMIDRANSSFTSLWRGTGCD
jgi:hypothetical protein